MIIFPFSLPGRYKFTGERLQGGQGYVYICQDEFLARKVAIKVMSSISDVDLLRTELASMRDVRSPHVAEIYDLVFAKRSAMAGLVQEYVSGFCLDEYATVSHEREAYMRTLWQLAKGLADIHREGKIHRDIKPSNIRFDSEGVLKILDFGITSEVGPHAYTVNAKGTRYFLAPEFYDPPPIKLTFAGDVYAYGVTAWYLASKVELPNALKEIPPQRSEPVPSLAMAWPDWPHDLLSTFDAALKVRPQHRPTMSEIKDTLEKHLLYGKHRATFNYGAKTQELSTPGQTVTLGVSSDSIVIGYDGLIFSVKTVSGNVYINNMTVTPGTILPDSCVFTLGARSLQYLRTFVPMDTAHPEVIL